MAVSEVWHRVAVGAYAAPWLLILPRSCYVIWGQLTHDIDFSWARLAEISAVLILPFVIFLLPAGLYFLGWKWCRKPVAVLAALMLPFVLLLPVIEHEANRTVHFYARTVGLLLVLGFAAVIPWFPLRRPESPTVSSSPKHS